MFLEHQYEIYKMFAEEAKLRGQYSDLLQTCTRLSFVWTDQCDSLSASHPLLFAPSVMSVRSHVTPCTFPFYRIGRDLRRDKGSYSNDALQRDQEKEAHKVMKILTVVVIVFALLMLPNHIVFLWFDFGNGSK